MDIAVSPVFPGNSGTSHLSEAEFRKLRLLSALGEEELAMLARAASLEAHERRSVIFATGNPSDAVFILIRGRVRVFLEGVDGRKMTLRVLGPGEFFGEMGLLDDNPSRASVVTLEACELIRIAGCDFKRCLAANFDMAMSVMGELVRRLRDAENLIGSLALVNVIGRVLRVLRQAAEIVDGRMVLRKKLSPQDIASRVGASRETVSRALKHLRLQGQVEVLDGTIIIRDDALPYH